MQLTIIFHIYTHHTGRIQNILTKWSPIPTTNFIVESSSRKEILDTFLEEESVAIRVAFVSFFVVDTETEATKEV